MHRVLASLAIAVLSLACGADHEPEGSGGAGGAVAPPTTFGGDRPVELFVPSSYDAATPAPLLILLHGYRVSGLAQEVLFRLEPIAEARGVLYAHPDGTVDSEGSKFWNATELCCDFDGTGVDDSSYLIGLVDAISAAYNVDPKRVFFAGHSNGHFMSYRMACDHAHRVAAIAGLAGGMFQDPASCAAEEPVSVLHMHGTADEAVPYDLAAEASAAAWAGFNGCEDVPVAAPNIDLESSIEGAETTVQIWNGCAPGTATELWSIEGGKHIPNLGSDFGATLVDWLLAHPKP